MARNIVKADTCVKLWRMTTTRDKICPLRNIHLVFSIVLIFGKYTGLGRWRVKAQKDRCTIVVETESGVF